MIYPTEADVVQLVSGIVHALEPYAATNKVQLILDVRENSIALHYQPFELIQSLSQLLCEIISLVPPATEVIVRIQKVGISHAIVEIESASINMAMVGNISTNKMYPFQNYHLQNVTLYKLELHTNSSTRVTALINGKENNDNDIPRFYAEIRKRLQSHFIKAEKLVASLSNTRPADATFLQKVNVLIRANLGNDMFDTIALSKGMAMSRTQLFRRLKPLIRQAPANYIRAMRLQKAKEMLETTGLTVSEVAFKAGFQTPSHFTRVFQQQYGVLPSVFRRVGVHVTKE